MGRFVTLVYLILEAGRGTVRIANGGHPYPLIARKDSEISQLKTQKGLPLGLMNSEFSEISFAFEVGDRVLIYTDGLLEATNSKGEEYGGSRLLESLQKPSTSAAAVLANVQEFAKGGALSDDATAIVVRRE